MGSLHGGSQTRGCSSGALLTTDGVADPVIGPCPELGRQIPG